VLRIFRDFSEGKAIKALTKELNVEEVQGRRKFSFIGEGKGTRALGEALKGAEQKALALRAELHAYEASKNAVFKAPPVEWIAARLMALQAVLEAEPSKSALELRRVLGRVRLLPVQPQIGKPYYQAETALRVLDLVKVPEDGSNWLHWWRRWASNPRPETLRDRHLHP